MPADHEAFYRALYRVATLVNQSLELERTLGQVVAGVAEAMGARACSLRLLDASGLVLELAAQHGLSERYVRKGPVEVAASAIDSEALAGKVLTIGEVAHDTRLQYPEELAREGIHSVLCVPLIRHERPIGVMRVYTGETHVFEADEAEFLQALADICALAIENARMYARLEQTYHQSMEALWGSAPR